MITYRALGREGRLGNQLWQIAATLGTARRLGDSAGFGYWRYRPYFSIPDSLFPDDVDEADDLGIVHPQQRWHLEGVEDVVRRAFAPRPEVWSRLATRFADVLALPHKTSVHVRRGDYVDFGGYFTILEPDYYAEAMSILEGPYLVFSDNVDWCRQNLVGDCVFMANNMDHEDLLMMAACDAHIASNSTFAWWGSWLSGGPTVYPRQWGRAFDDNGCDVLPDDAITLDVTCESSTR
jgi:hypothetical protein